MRDALNGGRPLRHSAANIPLFFSCLPFFFQWQIIGRTAQSGWPPGERHLIRKRHLPADKGGQHFATSNATCWIGLSSARGAVYLATWPMKIFSDLIICIERTLQGKSRPRVIVLISRIIGMALGYGRKLIAEWINIYTFVQPERAGWCLLWIFNQLNGNWWNSTL